MRRRVIQLIYITSNVLKLKKETEIKEKIVEAKKHAKLDTKKAYIIDPDVSGLFLTLHDL